MLGIGCDKTILTVYVPAVKVADKAGSGLRNWRYSIARLYLLLTS